MHDHIVHVHVTSDLDTIRIVATLIAVLVGGVVVAVLVGVDYVRRWWRQRRRSS